MKLLTASCVAVLLASVAGYAQTTTGSTVIGKMTVKTTVSPTTTSGSAATKSKTTISDEVTILRSANGQIEYKMLVPNVQTIETDGSIDKVTTGEIFNALAAEAVRQGTSLGYTSGSGTVQTGVWCETYINRTGSGVDTRFSAADSGPLTEQIFKISSGSSQYVGTYTQYSSEQSLQ